MGREGKWGVLNPCGDSRKGDKRKSKQKKRKQSGAESRDGNAKASEHRDRRVRNESRWRDTYVGRQSR